jgi:hypothetical protein
MGNVELAELINGSDAHQEDRVRVKAGDIAKQKQAMKKAGDLPRTAAGKGRGRRGGKRRGRQAAGGQGQGVAALKRLVDRLADVQRW